MKGYDISDDEMAKTHARYMIGGTSDVGDERLFRFGASSFFVFRFVGSLVGCRFWRGCLRACVDFLVARLGVYAIGPWDFVRTPATHERAGGCGGVFACSFPVSSSLAFRLRLASIPAPAPACFSFTFPSSDGERKQAGPTPTQCSAALRSFSRDILARDAGYLASVSCPVLPCLASQSSESC